jgi:thiosulfate/3-mercaptopyruvate sulfurtransferase
MKYLFILLTLNTLNLSASDSLVNIVNQDKETIELQKKISTKEIKLNPFISSLELKNIINNQNIIILDVDNKAIYNAGHIKGSIHFDVNLLVKNLLNPYNLMKKDSAIETEIQELGICKNSAVVIYAHNTIKGTQNSAYLALVLITYGFENVSILDGGFMAWVFQKERLVSAESNTTKNNGDFKAQKNENIIVNKDYILTNLKNIKVLDARETKCYFGTKKANKISTFGHISSAKSSCTNDKFLLDGLLRDKKELQSIYYQGLELKKDDDIVVYAKDVFQASMEWYLLYKVMNFKNVKIYEAGLIEYFEDDSNPVTRFKFE